jgi:hypothetical protein
MPLRVWIRTIDKTRIYECKFVFLKKRARAGNLGGLQGVSGASDDVPPFGSDTLQLRSTEITVSLAIGSKLLESI